MATMQAQSERRSSFGGIPLDDAPTSLRSSGKTRSGRGLGLRNITNLDVCRLEIDNLLAALRRSEGAVAGRLALVTDEALRLRPTRVSAWLLRAIVRRRMGQDPSAIERALARQFPVWWGTAEGRGLARLRALRRSLEGNRSSTVLSFRHPRGGWVVRDTQALEVPGWGMRPRPRRWWRRGVVASAPGRTYCRW